MKTFVILYTENVKTKVYVKANTKEEAERRFWDAEMEDEKYDRESYDVEIVAVLEEE